MSDNTAINRTDKEILGSVEHIREKTLGRPKVNRDLACRLILSGKYYNKQLRKKLK